MSSQGRLVAQLARRVQELETAHRRREGMWGEVVFVWTEQAGTELVGAHTVGVTELHVTRAIGLSNTSSGRVTVGDDTLSYDDMDTSEDPDWTQPYDTLYLSAATTNSYADGAPVLRSPVKKAKLATVYLWEVDPVDPVECIVKRGLWHTLADGPRDPGAGEDVYVIRRGQQFVIDHAQDEPALDLATAYGVIAGNLVLTGSLQLLDGGQLVDGAGSPLMTASDTGALPSAVAAVQAQLLTTTNALDVIEAQLAACGRNIDGGVY